MIQLIAAINVVDQIKSIAFNKLSKTGFDLIGSNYYAGQFAGVSPSIIDSVSVNRVVHGLSQKYNVKNVTAFDRARVINTFFCSKPTDTTKTSREYHQLLRFPMTYCDVTNTCISHWNSDYGLYKAVMERLAVEATKKFDEFMNEASEWMYPKQKPKGRVALEADSSTFNLLICMQNMHKKIKAEFATAQNEVKVYTMQYLHSADKLTFDEPEGEHKLKRMPVQFNGNNFGQNEADEKARSLSKDILTIKYHQYLKVDIISWDHTRASINLMVWSHENEWQRQKLVLRDDVLKTLGIEEAVQIEAQKLHDDAMERCTWAEKTINEAADEIIKTAEWYKPYALAESLELLRMDLMKLQSSLTSHFANKNEYISLQQLSPSFING